jgi:hypothetical protein
MLPRPGTELRRRLSRLGPVLVANAGEYLWRELDDSFMAQARLAPRLPGECYRVPCPFCSDTQHSLWVSYRWGEYSRERKARNLSPAVCYHRDCLARPGVARQLSDLVFGDGATGLMPDPAGGGLRPTVTGWPVKAPGPYSYPLHALEDDHPAVLYLRGRGYDTKYLGRHLRVGYCPVAHPEFRTAQGRIIIPVCQGYACVGWQARYVGEPPDPRVPKDYVMPGMDTTRVLYNFDVARKYPIVVVCAGAPDVWAFGPEAVALLGREVSSAQARLVASAWGRGSAVILLGGDAGGEAQQAHDALAGAARQRVIVSLPAGKDPGDIPREALRQIVFAAARQQGADLGAPPGPGVSGN